MKKCSECKIEKDKKFFYSNKARSTGTYSRCIDCEKKHIKYFKSIEITVDEDKLSCEYWKQVYIDGIEYPYLISNCGRVKIIKSNKLAKPSLDQRGYSQLVLVKNGKRVSRRIHRIVAENFMPNIYNKREVNHIDGNKLNNHVSNLEWMTSKENVEHAIKNRLR